MLRLGQKMKNWDMLKPSREVRSYIFKNQFEKVAESTQYTLVVYFPDFQSIQMLSTEEVYQSSYIEFVKEYTSIRVTLD